MTGKKFRRIIRTATAEERERHADIRKKVMEEFPPALSAGRGQRAHKVSRKTRIMWIERKEGLAGPARIGRVMSSKSGPSLHYRGKTFQTLSGRGFRANYFDVDTGEEYWISGCRKDGRDALYNTDLEIDEDVREEYWTLIRKQPENVRMTSFRAQGKCK